MYNVQCMPWTKWMFKQFGYTVERTEREKGEGRYIYIYIMIKETDRQTGR